MSGNGFKTMYRLPEALGGGMYMGGPVGGDDAVTLMVQGIGLVRMPVDALKVVPDAPPESVSYPEALRRMALVAREDGDDVEFGAKVARMLEVAADRWGDRKYRGDRLLQTVADFGRYGAETLLGLKVEVGAGDDV